MSCRLHGYPWPSLATSRYRSSPPAGLQDYFLYPHIAAVFMFESSVLSTEKDIDTRLTKAWIAIDMLSIIWKSNVTDKMKRSFFPGTSRVDTAIDTTTAWKKNCVSWMQHLDADKTVGEEARRQLHKNVASNIE